MATWPVSLPQAPLIRGFDEEIGGDVIRFKTDTGPSKTRRRTTASVLEMNMSMYLTYAQRITFIDFIDNTLEGGALPFDFLHPVTGATISVKFVVPPKIRLRHLDDALLFELRHPIEVQP